MAETRYKIDNYTVEFYAVDRKGSRKRWGDRGLKIYSDGREIASAIFSDEDSSIPEPYMADGKIHYFAPSSQFSDLLAMLRKEKNSYIAWRPAYDPKESLDGDAVFVFEDMES